MLVFNGSTRPWRTENFMQNVECLVFIDNACMYIIHLCIGISVFLSHLIKKVKPRNGIQLRNSSVRPQMIPSPLAYTTDTLRSEITLLPRAKMWVHFHFLAYIEHPTMEPCSEKLTRPENGSATNRC